MSKFDNAFATVGSDPLFDQFGETVSYTPVGGSASDITARIIRDAFEREDSEDGLRTSWRARVVVKTADVASPQEGDVLTFHSLTWKVDAVDIESAKGEAALDVIAVTDQEFSGEGSRRQIS